MSLESADLARLSALLEDVIELDADGRAHWLEKIGGDDARLLPALRLMLASTAGGDPADPLVRGPSFTLPGEPGVEPAFRAGEMVGPYRLQREIGRGGMGEVWLAERGDGQLQRQVALKLPALGVRHSVLVQRFARERDILARLTHPNIARLYDAGLADDGQPYLALEYVEGLPISSYCDQHKLDLRQRVVLFRQVLAAVQYAHGNLVIHRDLKPSNVLVTPAGQAMLLDFGIAKLLGEDAGEAPETELTRLGGRAMTLDYAAPEQLTGAPVSTATDIWALGVLLYELIAGRRPFRGETRGVQEDAIRSLDPSTPSPRTLSHLWSVDLDTVVLKALKKEPADRYASADAFDLDLGRWLAGEPVLARRSSAWHRTRKFVGRHRLGVAAAAGVALVVLGSSGVALRQAQVAREQAKVARTEAKTAEAVQGFLEGIFRSNRGDQAAPVEARKATAEQLLDQGAARIDRELADAPVAKLRVLRTLGDMYEDMGQLVKAASLRARQAALASLTFGEGSTAHLGALADLANALIYGGKVLEGGRVLDQAERVAERHGPVDDAVRIDLDLARAGFYLVQSEPGGLPFAERAARLTERRPPGSKRVQALSSFADALNGVGRFEEARVAATEAVAVGRAVGGEADSVLADAFTRLAGAQDGLGDPAAAEASMREAVALTERNAGPMSTQAVTARVNLGNRLWTRNQIAAAVKEYRSGRAAIEAAPASPDRDVMRLQLVTLQARAERAYGRPESALADVTGVIANGGVDDHPGFKVILRAVAALCLVDLGRFAEAAARMDEVAREIETGKRASPGLALDRDFARVALAQAKGDVAAARQALERVPEQRRGLAAAEVALLGGDPAKAETLSRAALAQAHGIDIFVARLDMVIGRALVIQGRSSEALPVLDDALRLRLRQLDPEHSPLVADAHVARAEALWATRDVPAAREALAEAERILGRHRILGPQFLGPATRLRTLIGGQRVAAALPP